MFISHASLQSWNRKGILGQNIYHIGDGIDRRRCKEVSCWVYTGRYVKSYQGTHIIGKIGEIRSFIVSFRFVLSIYGPRARHNSRSDSRGACR